MALRGLRRILQVKIPPASFARGIVSLKNPAYEAVEKPAPYPEDSDYQAPWSMMEKTTSRFDNNSKIIVVEGAHAVGKTDLAKQLAEEFGMRHMAFPGIEETYFNYYGEDLRNYKQYLSAHNQPYAEKEFFRNPTGPLEGDGDRYVFRLYMRKLEHYMMALRHLFNSGQGVVLEGSVFNDYAYVESAYNQGWIDRGTREYINESRQWMIPLLLRPHVIIYLDASVDTVQKKIKARGNEWDKDSPVWSNRQYLSDIYNEMKRGYLKEQQRFSYVFVYDWSEPGDVEVVVEDIESLELDWVDEYSDQQIDWKQNRDEQHHTACRYMFSNYQLRNRLLNRARAPLSKFKAVHLWRPMEDTIDYHQVFDRVDSMRYSVGWNPHMGESPMWKIFTNNYLQEMQMRNVAYPMVRIPVWGNEKGLSTIKKD